MISETLKKLITPSVDPSVKLTGVGMFLGKLLDKFDTRVAELEARQLQKGDRGDRGEQGPAGKDGRDGKDGKDGVAGPKGPKGDTGPVGPRGEKGVSVVDAEVAIDGNLVLKLSNGKLIDIDTFNVNTRIEKYFSTINTVAAGSATNLDGLTDVVLGTLSNGQVLTYNGSTLQWENATPASVPSQFNPIAGTNVTLSGTYPNITFNAASGGAGTTVVGSSTVDFGSKSTDTSASVSYPTIASSNRVQAWIDPIATATNTADNHWVDDLDIVAKVTAGVGFTLYAKCKTGFAHGQFTVGYTVN